MKSPWPLVAAVLGAVVLGVGIALAYRATSDEPVRTEPVRPPDPTPRQPAAGRPPSLRALLIGVSDYGSPNRFDLPGTQVDVDRVERFLVDRLGVPDADVRVLRDERATVEDIVRNIEAFLLREDPQVSDVLLFFSGHGSRVDDRADVEPDGMDSSLIAYDSRRHGQFGEKDITDDALYSLLRPLTERDPPVRVTLWIDACHSGGIMRGARIKAMDEGQAPPPRPDTWSFWPDGIRFFDDDERPAGELDHYVAISACAPEQSAYEQKIQGVSCGRFTFGLVRALSQRTPGASWRNVAARAVAIMNGLPLRPQTLWIEGSELDRGVFGGIADRGAPGFAVHVGPAGKLRVSAGSLDRVTTGTVLTIRTEDGLEVGRATVEWHRLANSRAAWIGTPSVPVQPDQLFRAVVHRSSRDLPPLRIRVEVPMLRAVVDACPTAVAIDDIDPPDYVVALDEGGGRVELRTLEGIVVAKTGAASTAAEFERWFEAAARAEQRFRGLWSLADPADRGGLSNLVPDWLPVPASDLGPRASHPTGFVAGAPQRRSQLLPEYDLETTTERPTRLRLRIRDEIDRAATGAQDDVFVHVLSVAEDRQVRVLWPRREGQNDRPLRGNELDVDLIVESPDARRFPLDRPMRDRILILAATRPLPVHRLDTSRPGSTLRSAGGAPLPFERLLTDPGTRSAGVDEAPSRWGVAWVDLLIRR